MILAARIAPSLDDQSMALLFQSGHAADRQDRVSSSRNRGSLRIASAAGSRSAPGVSST